MMFRSTTTVNSQYQYACKKYLANASIVAAQTEVGVLTKPNTTGYTVFMLDYLNFAIDTDIDNNDMSEVLDAVITPIK